MKSPLKALSDRKYARRRVEGCVESVCRTEYRHGPCEDCGKKTCGASVRTDPKTLKRRKVWVCNDCVLRPNAREEAARTKRTQRDLAMISSPVDEASIKPDVLPVQYAGPTREALRAFLASGSEFAEVPGISAETLNNSIGTQGLHNEMYAETRDERTILRRVPDRKAVIG